MTEPMTNTTPRRFRKKPVVIEAMLFDGTRESSDSVLAWLGDSGWTATRDDRGISFLTWEGTMLASPDDWIIRGVQGEFYPCKPDIFAATYEAVSDE